MKIKLLYFIGIFIMLIPCSKAQIIPYIIHASNPNASDGIIMLSVRGGIPPYSYHWNKGPENSNENLNLSPGKYCVTVTDVIGCCSMKACYTISSICPLLIEGIRYKPVCSGSDGELSAVISNDGTPPYRYLWNNGATTASLTNLSAGQYCVTVTDQSETSSFGCIYLENKLQVTAAINPGGKTLGAIKLHIKGGTAPYTYLWNNGATTQELSSVPAGYYGVTVTDQKGCKSSKYFVVGGMK